MAGPPDMPASELWAVLQVLPRPSKRVDFPRCLPGTDTPIGELIIWPLSQNEQMISNGEADRFAKKLLKETQRREDENLGYDSVYGNEVAVQVLYRACRDANDAKKSAFPSPGDVRDKLSADEVGALFRLYCQVQVELGPIVTRLSEEEMEAWVKKLADGGDQIPFPLLSSETQHRLLNFMASRLASFWTATTSVGSPQDEPSTEESAASEDVETAG